jgi:4-hydroxybenzoate polyprenyltransferase
VYPDSLKERLRDVLPLFGAQRLTSLRYACSVSFAMPQDALEPLLLCLALLLWIAGFDIIYASQDEAFDREAGLHSLVVRHGRAGALRISMVLHAGMLAALVALEAVFRPGWPFQVALSATAAALVYLHFLRRGDSLDGLNQDFFLANVAISVVVSAGLIASVFLHSS